MNNDLIPVEDRPDLARDPVSKAILSTDLNLLQEHRKKMAMMKSLLNNQTEIEQLRSEITEIKSLLKELISKKDK